RMAVIKSVPLAAAVAAVGVLGAAVGWTTATVGATDGVSVAGGVAVAGFVVVTTIPELQAVTGSRIKILRLRTSRRPHARFIIPRSFRSISLPVALYPSTACHFHARIAPNA